VLYRELKLLQTQTGGSAYPSSQIFDSKLDPGLIQEFNTAVD